MYEGQVERRIGRLVVDSEKCARALSYMLAYVCVYSCIYTHPHTHTHSHRNVNANPGVECIPLAQHTGIYPEEIRSLKGLETQDQEVSNAIVSAENHKIGSCPSLQRSHIIPKFDRLKKPYGPTTPCRKLSGLGSSRLGRLPCGVESS